MVMNEDLKWWDQRLSVINVVAVGRYYPVIGTARFAVVSCLVKERRKVRAR